MKSELNQEEIIQIQHWDVERFQGELFGGRAALQVVAELQ